MSGTKGPHNRPNPRRVNQRLGHPKRHGAERINGNGPEGSGKNGGSKKEKK